MLVWNKKLAWRTIAVSLLATVALLILTIDHFKGKKNEEPIDFTLKAGTDSRFSNVTIDIRYNESGLDDVFLGFDVSRTHEDSTCQISNYKLETNTSLTLQNDSSNTSCDSDLAPVAYKNNEYFYVKDDCIIRRHYKGDIFGRKGTKFQKVFYLNYNYDYDVPFDFESAKVTVSNINHLAIDFLYPTPDLFNLESVTYESKEKFQEILVNGLIIYGSSAPEFTFNRFFSFFPGLFLGVLSILIIDICFYLYKFN